jgi:hypothetical protein
MSTSWERIINIIIWVEAPARAHTNNTHTQHTHCATLDTHTEKKNHTNSLSPTMKLLATGLILLAGVLLSVLLSSTGVSAASPYNETLGLLSVNIAAASYCHPDTYENRTFVGMASGFKVTKTVQSAFDAVGFVGYLPSDGKIYGSFRGSSSVRNWLTDFDVVKKSYDNSYPECGCEVAQGFYNAEQSIVKTVVTEISKLKAQFPSYSVVMTGHSYGAAMAQLLSMDLLKEGIPSSVYNFGQPRTGDQKYANFVGSLEGITTYRVVHDKDIVPHWPFEDYLNYYHACSEVFEDEAGALHSCGTGTAEDGSATCEDPKCMNQYKPYQWRQTDHHVYLGVEVNCAAVSR